jgi:hypothetical protein
MHRTESAGEVAVTKLLWTCALVVMSSAACGDDGSSRICAPGAVQVCPCLGGTEGVQTCSDDGARWQTCECGGTDADADADGDGGADADADVEDVTDEGSETDGTPTRYAIGGTVSGLLGSGLVLQNNSGDDLAVVANGGFVFATPLDDGATYGVTVLTQPARPAQSCSVSAGTGTVHGADVTDVGVACTTGACAADCPGASLGDGVCNVACMLDSCGYDLGDCVTTAECAPHCTYGMLDDGHCDAACYLWACGLDNGDCPDPGLLCAPGCSLSMLGDDNCIAACSVDACNYDNGDCSCSPGCEPPMQGDGSCDALCMTPECAHDGGDCAGLEECAPDCPYDYLDDGRCDPACYLTACGHDAGDCPDPEWSCFPGCTLRMLGDGTCDAACDLMACHEDNGDC